jgi:hypothetical protein
VQVGFERMRRALDDRESYLLSVIKDQEAANERQIAEQEAELFHRREKIMEGYRDAQSTLEIEDKFTFISGAAEFEQRMDYYLKLDLTASDLYLTDTGSVLWDDADRAIHSIDFQESSGETRLPPPPPRVVPPSPSPVRPAKTPVQKAEPPRMPSRPVPATPPAPPPASTSSEARSPDSSNAIYINGLSPDTTEADIRDVFSRFGPVKMVNARHVASGGFAFVFFEDESGAAAALVDPRVPVKDRMTNVLAKQQILSGGGRWL